MGFPRASGDGPFSELRAYTGRAFPPRERGWSRTAVGWERRFTVSPARAGMVPACSCPWGNPEGFPRASGDGPVTCCETKAAVRFPPRERGWSLNRPNIWRNWPVSPARAGMVRLSSAVSSCF